MKVKHAGDCSIYQDGSDICDCGELRKAARNFNQDNYDDKIGEDWLRHLKGIDSASTSNLLDVLLYKMKNPPPITKPRELPLTLKQYSNGERVTVDVMNSRIYSKWIQNKHEERHFLHKDNRETFKEIFGKQDWCYNDPRRNHAWVRQYEGITYLLLTAKERGTSIEVLIDRDDISNMTHEDLLKGKGLRIISFVRKLITLIEKTEE